MTAQQSLLKRLLPKESLFVKTDSPKSLVANKLETIKIALLGLCDFFKALKFEVRRFWSLEPTVT